MNKQSVIKRIAMILMAAMLISMMGCSSSATDLMSGVKADAEQHTSKDDCDCAPVEIMTQNPIVTDFAVRLFQNSMEEGKNTLISPISVLTALAMTTNGADGETLAQMEAVLGLSAEELNEYVYAYMAQLPEAKNYKLSMANSIWFKDDKELFEVNPDFLQINANYYGADIFEAPFDGSTLQDINEWVKEETDEMIPEVLDQIPDDAIMYLINALAFDAKWEDPYEDVQVQDGIFTQEDGTQTDVTMMYSEEYSYLEDDKATGFIKYYEDGAYAFAALLPNEGVSVEEYAASLTGEHLNELLSEPKQITVFAGMPKFESEYSTEMKEILIGMGMEDAFDPEKADFSRMGSVSDGLNIVISRVIHKTYISVTENGTQAGAATVVEMRTEGAVEMSDYKTVTLDRPFIYMIIDCENHIPLFIGTTMTVQ